MKETLSSMDIYRSNISNTDETPSIYIRYICYVIRSLWWFSWTIHALVCTVIFCGEICMQCANDSFVVFAVRCILVHLRHSHHFATKLFGLARMQTGTNSQVSFILRL